MTETIESVTTQIDQQQLARDLVEAARADGLELVGPNETTDEDDQEQPTIGARHSKSSPDV